MTDVLPDDGDIRFLKHRDAGSVLNATFVFIKRNARELVLGFLAIVGPVALASGIAMALYFRQFGDFFQNPEAIESMSFGAFGVSYFGALVFGLLAWAVAQAVVGAFVRLYRLGEAGAVSVAVLWEESKGLILPMLGLNLLFGLVAIASVVIVALPLCLGVVAWLAILVWMVPYYAVTMASRAVEAGSVGEAWGRARVLVKGAWGFAFGAFFLALVVFYVIMLVLSMPLSIVMFGAMMNSPTGDPSAMFETMGVLSAPLQVVSMLGYLVPLMAAYFIHGRLAEELDGTSLHDDLDALADRSAATRWTGEPVRSTPPASGLDAPAPEAEPPAGTPEPPTQETPPSGFRGGGFGGGA